ncbi:MAG TPA: hypothetical protein VJG83_03115 [archaeon]|nr:hypothetical protein [archaeon]
MSEPLTYDLLVHPFYSLAYYHARDKSVLLENALLYKKIWFAHIRLLAKSKDRGLLIIRPDFEHAARFHLIQGGIDLKLIKKGEIFFSELKSYAKSKLKGREIVMEDPILGGGYRGRFNVELKLSGKILATGNKIGLAMGEYYYPFFGGACIDTVAKAFSQVFGQRIRISVSRSITEPGLHFPRNIESPIKSHHAAVLKRARHRVALRRV